MRVRVGLRVGLTVMVRVRVRARVEVTHHLVRPGLGRLWRAREDDLDNRRHQRRAVLGEACEGARCVGRPRKGQHATWSGLGLGLGLGSGLGLGLGLGVGVGVGLKGSTPPQPSSGMGDFRAASSHTELSSMRSVPG